MAVKIHEKYIKRCITLAKNGKGLTYPNPMVGCVIVHNNKIIGEGWHKKAGEPHAEVNAINMVKDVSLLSKSTIYVSLEPCSHFGKTPPCANLIVSKKIKKVVIGTIDFNAKVLGKGIRYLKENGCNVTVGVLENECKELNKRFFTYHLKKRPFIILKWAQTTSGYISNKNNKEQKPFWISNPYSKQLVHKQRATEQAILVGKNTVTTDNPKLTTRLWFGNNPLRIVVGKNLQNSTKDAVFNKKATTIIFNAKESKMEDNVEFIALDFEKNVVQQILKVLYKKEIQSLIVEGGSKTLAHFIFANLWDEAYVYEGNILLTKGVKAPIIQKEFIIEKKINTDTLRIYKNNVS